MKRKMLYFTVLFTVLIFFGCASVQDRNEDSVYVDPQTEMPADSENMRVDIKPYDTAIEVTNADNTSAENTDVSVSEDVALENGMEVSEESSENVPELYEGDVMEFIDIITDDMLDACREKKYLFVMASRIIM